MSMGIVVLPQVLRDRLGDEGAQALVDLLNDSKFVQKDDLEMLAERLEKKMAEMEMRLTEKIMKENAQLRGFVINSLGVVTAVLTFVMAFVRR